MTVVAEGAVETVRLWPDGPPTVIENDAPEVEYPVREGIAAGTTFIRNISDPTLSVFPAAGGGGSRDGIGVVVAPGGGWMINAWTHEGLDVARWLTAEGYTVFLLKYRVQATTPDQEAFERRMASAGGAVAAQVPAARKPRAISDLVTTPKYLAARDACADDGRRAVELVRSWGPERYGVRPDRLGMLGFSAGAFLTVDVAMDPRAEPLAFVAPIYGGETRGALVPADAPPLFSAVAQDDSLVKIVEGLHADWTCADRPAELHAFARGAHGFGMVRQGLPSDRWTDLFLAWLQDLELSSAQ